MKSKTNAEVAPAPSGQHTPTPWALVFNGSDLDVKGNNGNTLVFSFGEMCKVEGVAQAPGAEDAANMEFIVRAANCHDELLQCLRDLTGGLWIERAAEENWQISRMLNDARAAIAKAEGRGQ